MTPQFILRASLCRKPHCANEDNWKQRAESEIEDMGYAMKYGIGQGYTNPDKGILMANWNYFPRGIDSILERYGFAIEWSDEWTTCSNCGKALRTSADGYEWQPAYSITDSEILCLECIDPVEHLRQLEDNPHTANNIHSINPSDHGYVQIKDGFENGFHPGQNDNPKAIYKQLRADGIKTPILFNIDGVGQFDIGFSVWTRTEETEDGL
jgi:hypothetical protein